MRQLLRFAWVEAQCCLFAVLFFLGLVLVRLVPLPIDPADALLLWCLGVTVLLWLARWETGREVAVIFGFHSARAGGGRRDRTGRRGAGQAYAPPSRVDVGSGVATAGGAGTNQADTT